MSNMTTRMKKRLATRKMSIKELNQRLEDVQGNVIATAMALIIDMDYEDGKTYEELCARANRIVEKYNSVHDIEQFAYDVFEKTGVGVIRTEEEK